jgi:hypothetical protein
MASEQETHPSWCVRRWCTASRARTGAHRSQPIIVNEPPLLVTGNLYAHAFAPDQTLVEVCRNGAHVLLLPARVAHNLGRALVSLGKTGQPT